MTTNMQLIGDEITPGMPMSESEVNHLRRLLAWLRCEYMLGPDMQRGYLRGAVLGVQHGFTTREHASEVVQQKADEINRVPIYVRQAVKMLTKALRDHERKAGIVDAKAAP